MNEREKYKLISDISLAKGNGIDIEVKTNLEGWVVTYQPLAAIVQNIICGCSEYRIKPEPKTMRCRMYLFRNSEPCHLAFYPMAVWGPHILSANQIPGFVKWLTDEFTVELPE